MGYAQNAIAAGFRDAQRHGGLGTRLNLWLGKKMLNGVGHAANAIDEAALLGAKGAVKVLEPGGAMAQKVQELIIPRKPRMPLPVAIGAAGLLAAPLIGGMDSSYNQGVTDQLDDARQQGRTVMASALDQFIDSKKLMSAKTASAKTAGLQELMRALGQGGASKAIAGAVPRPGAAAGAMGRGGYGMGHGLAAAGLLGGGMLLGKVLSALGDKASNGPMGTLGYQINKTMNPGLGGLWDRIQGDEFLAKNLIEGFGKGMGTNVAGLASAGLARGVGGAQNAMFAQPQRDAVLQGLMANDDVLSRTTPDKIQEAYQTMARFAPTLATDPNAVRAFLREAVTYGAGPDYASISNLAKAEQTVNPPFGGK